ncbi:actin binding protein [Vermiconidia calcicola]|uniref:Actin binding protein n=1 Tax=Vermiconidia calcicola TaxID=1690605 RepID=A0ACC3NSG8_9PEZI|nr:actin binding protein [Vermiconidia calcicola]
MASLNLSSNGPSITNSYNKIVSSQPASGAAASSSSYGQWAVFSVQAPLVSAFQAESSKESVLKVQTTGEGELLDLIEEFSDGRIQFAFVKVKDPNTTLPKNVLIAWCGEGVPERTKGYFTSHLNAVSKVLHGYHVQVTARSDRDLTPELIVQKVADASGSKYSGGGAPASSGGSGPPPPVASKPSMPTKSFGGAGGFQPLASRSRAPQASGQTDQDGWGEDAPPVTRSQLEKVQSAYQPTKVNMGQLQSQQEPLRYQPPQQTSNGNADVVKGGYQPIGKVDINALRQQAQQQGSSKDDRPTVVKGAYEPVGKVDIADIRRRAQGAAPSAPSPPPTQPSAAEDERPKSLADRSAAFSQSGGSGGRLTSLPKPAVANRFGSQASTFGGTKAPQPGGFESKPAAPTAAPVGTASKTFADEGGKTPAQIWAEKKARERGTSGASETQPPGGAPASPLASQTSGGWQSGYAGKKWGVQIPSKTGGSGISEQRTGEEPVPEEQEEQGGPAPGGVGSIRDRFSGAQPMGAPRDSAESAPEPPPLDTSSKPNAGARGAPIPGLPQRPQSGVPQEEHQDLPPPPPRPMPEDESEDEEPEPMPRGSPIQVAMPVGRSAEPMEKAEPLPEQSMPTQSLHQTISEQRDTSPEQQAQDEDSARSAGVAAATSTFGQAEDSRSAGATGGSEAIAQYDYERAEENELELHDGDRITNIDMVDDDWWMGQNPRGETGLFPANYVELVADSAPTGVESARSPPPAPATQEQEQEPEPVSSTGQGATALAQYDYEAAEDNELSFPDGAKITDIEFPDEDWWLGSYGNNRGLFPANYVELER